MSKVVCKTKITKLNYKTFDHYSTLIVVQLLEISMTKCSYLLLCFSYPGMLWFVIQIQHQVAVFPTKKKRQVGDGANVEELWTQF